MFPLIPGIISGISSLFAGQRKSVEGSDARLPTGSSTALGSRARSMNEAATPQGSDFMGYIAPLSKRLDRVEIQLDDINRSLLKRV